MIEVTTLPLTGFVDAVPTADGRHLVIRAELAGQRAVLAVREDEVFRLMALLSGAASGLTRARALGEDLRHAFPIEGATCRPDRGGSDVVVDLRIPGGLEFSFVGTRAQARELAAALIAESSAAAIQPLGDSFAFDLPASEPTPAPSAPVTSGTTADVASDEPAPSTPETNEVPTRRRFGSWFTRTG